MSFRFWLDQIWKFFKYNINIILTNIWWNDEWLIDYSMYENKVNIIELNFVFLLFLKINIYN